MSEQRQQYFQAIKQALGSVKSLGSENVNESQFVVKELGLESIDIVDFCFEIEKILNVPFDLSEFFEELRAKSSKIHNDFTLGQMVDFLVSNELQRKKNG